MSETQPSSNGLSGEAQLERAIAPLELYRICAEQLRDEHARLTHFQTKCGLLLTASVVLAGAGLAVGRLDLISKLFVRVDVFLYYLFSLTFWIALVTGLSFVARTLFPATYGLLVVMREYVTWRDGYASELRAAGYEQSHALGIAQSEMLSAIISATSAATEISREANQRKQKFYSIALFAIASAAAILGIVAGFSRILIFEGIT